MIERKQVVTVLKRASGVEAFQRARENGSGRARATLEGGKQLLMPLSSRREGKFFRGDASGIVIFMSDLYVSAVSSTGLVAGPVDGAVKVTLFAAAVKAGYNLATQRVPDSWINPGDKPQPLTDSAPKLPAGARNG